MSKDNSDSFKLSRRKALASMGAIGAAGALGIGGTWAQFTDTEPGAGVTFTAGGVDGTVEAGASYNGNDVKAFNSEDFETLENVEGQGGPGLNFHLTDVKPGDYGCLSFRINVENNPAWVAMCLGYENNIDGETFEPEVVDGEGNIVDQDLGGNTTLVGQGVQNTPGELAQNLAVMPFYKAPVTGQTAPEWDPCIFFDEENDEFTVQNYDPAGAVDPTTYTASNFWSNAQNDLEPLTLEDAVGIPHLNTQGFGTTSYSTYDVSESIAVDDGCIFLNGAVGDDTQDNSQPAGPLQPADTLQVGLDWHLPFGVGNVAQGDQLDLQVGFVFGQQRHTESAELSNIYAPGQNTPNGGN